MVMFGVLPPDEEIAPEPVTAVTVPPPVASVCHAAPSYTLSASATVS